MDTLQPQPPERVKIEALDLESIPKPTATEINDFIKLLTTIAQRVVQDKKRHE